MNRELQEELRKKKEIYKKWREGQTSKEEYLQVTRHCRTAIREAQVESELRLAREARSNFFRYVRSKRKVNKAIDPMLEKL